MERFDVFLLGVVQYADLAATDEGIVTCCSGLNKECHFKETSKEPFGAVTKAL